jgi:pyruvate/2-oxoglutarate dehydrogenase complex dihydrolipoamide dehydrogenase (E3) component
VLATGSDPVVPPIDGLAGLEGVWTNREATQMRAVPRRMLVLGGGPVGVELAQVVARLGGEVALVEGAAHVLAREAAPLGEAVGEVLRRDGVELHLGMHATRARRDGADFVLDFADGTSLRGDRLLLATGRRPRAQVTVDDRMSAGDGLWAIGDVTGTWPLTYVGKHEARIAAANILGGDRRVDYRAVPRVVFTDPQAAAVGEPEGAFTSTVRLADVPRTATYTRAYAEHPGFLTLVSDGAVLIGACALGPEAGEWLQQATLGIQARVPLTVMRDTIQPFPTFSEAFVDAIADLADAAAAAPGRCVGAARL